MALIEVTLLPAWKCVVTGEDGTDDGTDEDETGALPARATADRTPEPPVETLPDAPEEDSGRRTVTLRRLIALGVVIGGAVAFRRLRSTVGRMAEDVSGVDTGIDITAGDDADTTDDTETPGDRDTMTAGERDADQ